jgi:hypothetical protein
MNTLEKFLAYYADCGDGVFWGNCVSLGELRAFAAELKQKMTCRECDYSSGFNAHHIAGPIFTCKKWSANWLDIDGLRCEAFQPRKKKVRKARKVRQNY